MGNYLIQFLGLICNKPPTLKVDFDRKSLKAALLLFASIYSSLFTIHLVWCIWWVWYVNFIFISFHFISLCSILSYNSMDSVGSADPELADHPTSAFWPCCRPWVTDGTLICPNWDSESDHSELSLSPLYSINSTLDLQYINKVYSLCRFLILL